jgi:hypothetical protein
LLGFGTAAVPQVGHTMPVTTIVSPTNSGTQ